MDYSLEPVKYIIEMMEGMKKEILDIRARIELQTYTIKDIAKLLGCSVSNVRNNPWKLPNFGKPDVGKHPCRWFYDTIRNWYTVSEDEHRLQWESMSALEKRNYLKIPEGKKAS